MTISMKNSGPAIAVALFLVCSDRSRADDPTRSDARPPARGEFKTLVADELQIDHRKDYSASPKVTWEPGRLRFGEGGSFGLKAEPSQVGRIRFICSVPPWSPPPPRPGDPAGFIAAEPYSRLTLVLDLPNRISIQVIWSDSHTPAVPGSLTVFSMSSSVKARHEVNLPANSLDGDWAVAWDHGLLSVQKQGRPWLESDILQDLPSGPGTVRFVGSSREIVIQRLELAVLPSRPIDAAAIVAMGKDSALAAEVRALSVSGRNAEALAKARDRLRRLEETSLAIARPLVLLPAWRELAETAVLAGRDQEVGPALGSALAAVRSECGETHPRTQEVFDVIGRISEALASRSVRDPHAPDPREALADMASRLDLWPGADHWLSRGTRAQAELAGRISMWVDDARQRRRDAQIDAKKARALMLDGKFDAAVKVARRAVAIARHLGPGTLLDRADALTALGLALIARGDAESSLAPFRDALEMREKVLGESHPSSCTARNNLACGLYRAGRYHQSVAVERKVYQDRVATLGRHAPATWQALVNLANAEVAADGHSTVATTLGRSNAELGTFVETGAVDADADSADFVLINSSRPPLPTITFYSIVPAAATPSVYDWRELVPPSLLEDPASFELGQARVLQRVLPALFSIIWLKLPGKPEPANPTPAPHSAPPSGRSHLGGTFGGGAAGLNSSKPTTEAGWVLALNILRRRLGPANPWTVLVSLREGNKQDPEASTGRKGPDSRSFLGTVARVQAAFGPDHPVTAVVAHNMGVSLAVLKSSTTDPFPVTQPDDLAGLQTVESLARSAAGILGRRLGDQHPHLASARELLAIALYHQGRPLEGVEELEECARMRKRVLGDQHPAVGDAENTLGVLFYRASRFGEARFHVEQALKVRRELRRRGAAGLMESVAFHHSVNDLGAILNAQGDLVSARRYFEEILRDSPAREPLRLAAANNLAVVLIESGDYAGAKRLFEGSDCPMASRSPILSSLNLGAISLLQGDDAGAERFFRSALSSSPDNPVALNSLGVIARKRGKLDEAIRHFEKVLGVGMTGATAPHKPSVDELKRFAPSLRVGVMRAGTPATGVLDTTLTRVSLGITLARKGEFDRAVEQLKLAAEVYDVTNGKNSPQAADTRRRLAIVQLMAGRPRDAKAAIDEALKAKRSLAEDIVPTLSEAEALGFIATLTERDPALSALRLIPESKPEDAYDVVWSTRAMVMRALVERRSLSDRDPKAAALLGRLEAVRSQLSTLTLRPETIATSQRRTSSNLTALSAEKERIERQLAEVCEPYRRQQARFRSRFTDLAGHLPDRLAVVDFVRYYDWSDPKAALPGSEPQPRFAAFVLRRTADAPGYRLAWVELGPAAPVDRDIIAWRAWLQAGGRDAGRGFKFRNDAVASGADPTEAPKRLRKAVWEPLEPHLAGVSTVVVVPDGSLARLPWPALPGAATGRLLIDDFAVATATTGQQILDSLTRDGDREDRGRQLVVGGLTYDAIIAQDDLDPRSSQNRGPAGPSGPWPYLPGTAREAEQVALIAPLPDLVYLQEKGEGGEAALHRLLPRGRFIHLATHGFFADPRLRSVLDSAPAFDPTDVGLQLARRPLDQELQPDNRPDVIGRNPLVLSGIVCSGANVPPAVGPTGLPTEPDGILTAEEVASLDLRQTRLVVLSACETGLGEVGGGEGVFGLQRAFQLAGARTTVASLWKVDDAATQILMVEFYRNLWEKKLGSLEALRRAQLTMIRRYDPESRTIRPADATRAHAASDREALPPYYWASFTLSGDWR